MGPSWCLAQLFKRCWEREREAGAPTLLQGRQGWLPAQRSTVLLVSPAARTAAGKSNILLQRGKHSSCAPSITSSWSLAPLWGFSPQQHTRLFAQVVNEPVGADEAPQSMNFLTPAILENRAGAIGGLESAKGWKTCLAPTASVPKNDYQ